MFLHHVTDADVEYHNNQVRSNYISAQRLISIQGLREIVGNTFIQMGSEIRGKAKQARDEAATRAAERHAIANGIAR